MKITKAGEFVWCRESTNTNYLDCIGLFSVYDYFWYRGITIYNIDIIVEYE